MSDVTPPPSGELIKAVKTLDLPLVEKLLSQHANPNETDEAGMTALMHAAREKPVSNLIVYNNDRVRELREHDLRTALNPEPSSISMDLHKSLELRIADKLIEAGADIDALDGNGFNTLLYAMQNNMGILKLLIINHARLDVETSFGTALEWAKNDPDLTEAAVMLEEAEVAEKYRQKAAAIRPAIAARQDLIRSQRPPTTVRRRPTL